MDTAYSFITRDPNDRLKSSGKRLLDITSYLMIVTQLYFVAAGSLFAEQRPDCLPFNGSTLMDCSTSTSKYFSNRCEKNVSSRITYTPILFLVPFLHIIIQTYGYDLSGRKKEIRESFKKFTYREAKSLCQNCTDQNHGQRGDNVSPTDHDGIVSFVIRDQKTGCVSFFVCDLLINFSSIALAAIGFGWLLYFTMNFDSLTVFDCKRRADVSDLMPEKNLKCTLPKSAGQKVWYFLLIAYFSIYIVVVIAECYLVSSKWYVACNNAKTGPMGGDITYT